MAKIIMMRLRIDARGIMKEELRILLKLTTNIVYYDLNIIELYKPTTIALIFKIAKNINIECLITTSSFSDLGIRCTKSIRCPSSARGYYTKYRRFEDL
jgi:hypothetical protein